MKLLAFLLLTVATLAHAAQLTVTWTDNSTTETGFAVERATGATGAFTEVTRTAANVTAYVDMTLVDNTTYSYRLRAFSVGTSITVYSSYSNVATGTTNPATPNAPSGASVVAPVAISLHPNDRIMISNTTSTVKPNPNDKSMSLPAGQAAQITSLKS